MSLISDLKVPRNIVVSSDPTVAGQVQSKTGIGAKTNLGPVPHLATGPTMIRPIDLLLSLGQAATPPVPAVMQMSFRWAILRYLWAFAPPSPTTALDRLRLSDHTTFLRLHQKTLFAEDMGVATTHLFLSRALASRYPGQSVYAVDAEQALWVAQASPATPGLPSVTVGTHAARRPDHLWVVVDTAGTGIEAVFVSESKATHRGPAAARRRMAEGCEQITQIGAKVGGTWVPLTGFVFGTSLNRRQIAVQAVDPEGLDLRGPVLGPERRLQRAPSITRLKRGRVEIADETGFRGAILDAALAQLVSFGAQTQAAAQLIGRGPTVDDGVLQPSNERLRVRAEADRETRETSQGVSTGLRVRTSLSDGEDLELFFGVDDDIRNAVLESDPTRERSARASFQATSPSDIEDPEDDSIATAVSPNGATLQIRRLS